MSEQDDGEIERCDYGDCTDDATQHVTKNGTTFVRCADHEVKTDVQPPF